MQNYKHTLAQIAIYNTTIINIEALHVQQSFVFMDATMT